MRGWQPVAWTKDIARGVYYYLDVHSDGTSSAVYSHGAKHERLGDTDDVAEAMTLAARHQKRHHPEAKAPWYVQTWALHQKDATSYYLDVEQETGEARAAYVTRFGSDQLGKLPDVGHGMLACSKHADSLLARALSKSARVA